jgi:hypothetical protein
MGANTAPLADAVTDDHIRHGPDGDLYGPEGFAVAISEYHAALWGLHLTVLDIVAAESLVPVHGDHDGWGMG